MRELTLHHHRTTGPRATSREAGIEPLVINAECKRA
jgi:hypothetical protein